MPWPSEKGPEHLGPGKSARSQLTERALQPGGSDMGLPAAKAGSLELKKGCKIHLFNQRAPRWCLEFDMDHSSLSEIDQQVLIECLLFAGLEARHFGRCTVSTEQGLCPLQLRYQPGCNKVGTAWVWRLEVQECRARGALRLGAQKDVKQRWTWATVDLNTDG